MQTGDFLLLGVSAAVAFWLKPQAIFEAINRSDPVAIGGQAALAVVMALSLFAVQDSQTFIYFRF